ncbi:MAG TPA: DUF6526 family protein [Gemmatimonas sp.]|nr:DUF6526 family protein [Gemmatimonas sp.]
MSTERPQNFANHTQWTPGFHFFASPLAIIYLVWAIQRLVAAPGADRAFTVVGALALFAGVAMSRLMALKVQDRVIRLEERLRLATILPADLQPHIGSIRAGHLVALRFASDAEVPALVREIIANPAIAPKEIKGKVKVWRADWFRA